jgi:hypothetical protein
VSYQLGQLGAFDRSAGLLVGRTHLSGTTLSLVGGDPGTHVSSNYSSLPPSLGNQK